MKTAATIIPSRKAITYPPANRTAVTTVILLVALVGFEMFNYATTQVALKDVLGDLTVLGLQWAAILTIAFCCIDFAGVIRLFSPAASEENTRDAWYLFGAWLLAATMNAILTWWGVSMSVADHAMKSTTIIDPLILTRIVPVFVAVMVWITRILLIGSLTLSYQQQAGPVRMGSRNIHRLPPANRAGIPAVAAQPDLAKSLRPVSQPARASAVPAPRSRPAAAQSARPASRGMPNRPELEYVSEPSFNNQPAFHHLAEGRDSRSSTRL